MAQGLELATAYVSLSTSAKGLRREIDREVGGAVDAAGDKHGRTLGDRLAGGFKTAAKVGFAGAAGVATAALVKGFGRLKSLDDAQGKLRGLGHSAQNVDKIMANALASVKGTAFGMDEAATTAAGAVAAGIKPGKDLQAALTLVGDAATIAGTDMSSMGAIFNKVAASNKIQGDVIAQLGDQGIPILQFLSKELGVSAEETAKLASKGEVDFETFRKAMQNGLGGAAQQSGKTFTGAMKNMGAALGRLGANVLSGVFPKMQGGFGGITALLDRMGPAAEEWGKKLGTAVEWVAENVGGFVADFKAGEGAAGGLRDAFERVFGFVQNTAIPAARDFIGWMKEHRSTIAAVASVVAGAVVAFKAFMIVKNLIAVIKAARVAMIAFNASLVANPIGIIVVAIGALVGGLIYLYKNNDKARAIMQAAWAAIKGAITAVVGWLKGTAWPVMQTVFRAIGAVVGWLWGTIVKPYFTFMFGLWKTVFGWVAQVGWPILRGAFNLIAGVVKWLWNNAIKPYFGLIWGIAKSVFGWVKNTGWPLLRTAFHAIAGVVKWLWNNAIKPNFDRIRSGASALIRAFEGARDGIGRAFSTLKAKITGPIRSVLDWINKNFIGPVNRMLEKIGVGFRISGIGGGGGGGKGAGRQMGGQMRAAGGYINGWSPNDKADNIPAWLTAGEYVLPVRAVRALTRMIGPGGLEALRRGHLPGYAMGGKVGGLNPTFRRALDAFNAAAGGRFSVISGLRTYAEQVRLYNLYLAGRGNLAARPGTSRHESGNAADLFPSSARDTHGALARQFGLHFPVPGEAWHVELINGFKGGGGGGGAAPRRTVFGGLAGRIIDQGRKALDAILNRLPFQGFWAGTVKAVIGKAVDSIVEEVKAAAGAGATTDPKYANGGMVKPLLFDSGGVLPTGLSAVVNKTGKPEPLLRADQPLDLSDAAIERLADAYARRPLYPSQRAFAHELVTVQERWSGR